MIVYEDDDDDDESGNGNDSRSSAEELNERKRSSYSDRSENSSADSGIKTSPGIASIPNMAGSTLEIYL